MKEKEIANLEFSGNKEIDKEELQLKFLQFLSEGEVHEARKILKEAEKNEIEINTSGEEFKNTAQKAVEDSLRKGHIRHAERLMGFTSENKIIIDLSRDEIVQALSEGFELCGPNKKEEILEFAKQNQIEINT